MKLILLIISVMLSSCGTLTLPQDPTKASNEFECSNYCAALGMKGVFVGSRCGCEKR